MGPKLFRIAGLDIHVDWSLLIIFALITASLALGVFPAWHPDWEPGVTWLTAVVAAFLFFASVLLHELSHALVGRRHGVEIRRITLFVFGGMAHMEREPDKWRAELWMAAVGPLTSFALGALFLLWAALFVDRDQVDPQLPQTLLGHLGPFPTLLLWLGQVNILLALFNLVPGFPLDGGRVLRAILWASTGSLRRATQWAAAVGQGFAGFLIACGLLMMLGFSLPVFGTGTLGGLWLAFIGWFLYSAALMSYRQLLTRESLEGIPVSRLMWTGFQPASPRISLQALIEAHLLRSGQRMVPVVEDGRFLGLVCLQDVKRVAQDARTTTPVAKVMTPLARLRTVARGTDAFEALSIMGGERVNQLPVMEGERLVGLVRREDVLNWLALNEAAANKPAHALR
jgi:Zn-dependent protease/predicted transcriptional regulator